MSDEPDEALLWSRQYKEHRAYLQELMAVGYRAGQAASAERIKALEHIAGAAQQRANDHGEQLLDAYERIKVLEEAIDAARLNGIRLGLEAVVKELWAEEDWSDVTEVTELIRALDPETIAKEADR
jgi:4-aminobutyrate aminotransferase-like enzyme